MKAKLEFDMEDQDDKEKLNRMLKVDNLVIALEDIHNKVWRPNFKHGYSEEKIKKLIDKCGTYEDEHGHEVSIGSELIEALHEIYISVLQDNEVDDF